MSVCGEATAFAFACGVRSSHLAQAQRFCLRASHTFALEPFAGLTSAPWFSGGTVFALGTSSTLLPSCFAHLCPRTVRWTYVRSLVLRWYGLRTWHKLNASAFVLRTPLPSPSLTKLTLSSLGLGPQAH